MSLGDILKNNFAKNLQNLRSQNGLTQARLAEVLNEKFQVYNLQLQRTSIVNYEKKEAMPRIDALYCIAKYFGRTIDQVISDNMDESLVVRLMEGYQTGPRAVVTQRGAPGENREKSTANAADVEIDDIMKACVDGVLHRQFFLEFSKRLYKTLCDEAPSAADRERFEKTFFRTFVGCQISKSAYLEELARKTLSNLEFEIYMAFGQRDMNIANLSKAHAKTEQEVVDIFNKAQSKITSAMEEKVKS